METNLSRRQALLPIAALVSVGTVATTAAAVSPGIHPDAALLAAWEGYKATYREYCAAPDVQALHDEICERMGAHEDVLRASTAKTTAGIVVKLKFCYAIINSSESGHFAVFGDVGQSEDDWNGWGEEILWNVITDVQRIAA